MKNLLDFNKYRQISRELDFYGVIGGETEGMFLIPYKNEELKVIATSGEGWDHVSVSVNGKDRVPDWYEMEFIKRLFFRDNEIAIEYHMPPKDHINCNPNVLHMWRPHNKKIPVPPSIMV